MRTTSLAALLSLITLTTAAHADELWCGFLDKAGSAVHCGYSSLAECKQSLGDQKDAVCMPSPSFAKTRHGARNG